MAGRGHREPVFGTSLSNFSRECRMEQSSAWRSRHSVRGGGPDMMAGPDGTTMAISFSNDNTVGLRGNETRCGIFEEDF
ncbi:hypothetical protein G6O67_002254 [Ophiocordyceps sinensis]|uniref:Uncharacterized protein n=1 Tax=Ophiocordyceps sinensis TaxID=72228 RepID=A0A8H4V714_9HYPO|nr:hypothetical protein G6O67_002254 [Ophiocordyceps sinensis]